MNTTAFTITTPLILLRKKTGVTINKKSTTTEPPPSDSSLSHGGGGGGGLKCILLVPNYALESAVVEVQEMFSSHGGHLTNAMYHHRETL